MYYIGLAVSWIMIFIAAGMSWIILSLQLFLPIYALGINFQLMEKHNLNDQIISAKLAGGISSLIVLLSLYLLAKWTKSLHTYLVSYDV